MAPEIFSFFHYLPGNYSFFISNYQELLVFIKVISFYQELLVFIKVISNYHPPVF